MEALINGYHICTENPALQKYNMHTHDFYEIYYFLEGKADYCIEGNRYHLQRGDIMVIRKGEVHTIQLHSYGRYERMYVHFDISAILEFTQQTDLLCLFHDRPLGKYNHFSSSVFPNGRIFEYFQKICHAEREGQKLCYLLPLLSELNDRFAVVKSAPMMAEIDPSASVIQYINRNLSENLSLDQISQQFYLSKTHLNRIFKQSTGTTVWKYINVKRLFFAKELLEAGMLPTEIYLQCGFNDYTTFYRSYKHHFGVSPCNAKKTTHDISAC